MKKILTLSLAFSALGIAQNQTVIKTFEFPITLGYTVELPPDYDSTKTYPLLVGIHGPGEQMSNYAGLAQRLIPEGAIGLYPESAFPAIFTRLGGGPVGWLWSLYGDMTVPEFASFITTLDQSLRWVVECIEEVKRNYPVDSQKVFIFGFSQGANVSFTLGVLYPKLFRGVIPVAGGLEYDILEDVVLDSAIVGVPVLAMHGFYDDSMEFAWTQNSVFYLDSLGADAEFQRYPAGRTVTIEMYEDARDFIWCELNKQDVKPLARLLNPAEPMGPSEHAELLRYVLCAQESIAEIEAGLLNLYEEDADPVIKKEIIYLLGARRCKGAEDMLTRILNDKAQSREMREAAYAALARLATESAWNAVGTQEKKLVITMVFPGSQAESLGLSAGDVILNYNRKPVTTDESLKEAKASVKQKQDEVEMVIERSGERITLKLRPGPIGLYTEERMK